MGNEMSTPNGGTVGSGGALGLGPGAAEDLLRGRMQDYNPFNANVPGGSNPAGQEDDSKRTIKATENAPPLDARAIAISAAAFLMEPERFQWAFMQGAVRRGYVDRLQIQFDAQNMTEFVPKLTRLLSDANLIHTLELFSDKLPKCRLLAFFSFPNVLDSLPKRMEALRSVHFATAAGQLLHFDVIAKVMMRAPNLCAVKIEGAQVVLTSNNYEPYIPCGLHALILVKCDLKVDCVKQILCRSQRSLRRLHVEQVTNLLRDVMASYISLYLPEMTNLTVCVPDATAINDSIVELQDVIDLAFARPVGALQELYVSGLAMSGNAFLRQSNSTAMIRTPCPSLQRLTMHWCNRCPMSNLTVAIMQGKIPRLSWLEAIWGEADYNMEDLSALYAACEKNSIAISPKMREYYAWYDQEYRARLLAEQKTTKQHKEDLSRLIEKTAAAIPDPAGSRSSASHASSSKSRRRSHSHSHSGSRGRTHGHGGAKDKKGSRSASARHSPKHKSQSVSESESEQSEERDSNESSSDESESEDERRRSSRRKSKSKSRSRSQRRRSR